MKDPTADTYIGIRTEQPLDEADLQLVTNELEDLMAYVRDAGYHFVIHDMTVVPSIGGQAQGIPGAFGRLRAWVADKAFGLLLRVALG